MKTDIRIYVAGTVTATQYRDYTHNKYGNTFTLVDPLKIVDQHASKEMIVESDKALIEGCNVLIAFVEKATFGTVMEIIHACSYGIPVIVINPKMDLLEDNWLAYHSSNIVSSIDECFDLIEHNELLF